MPQEKTKINELIEKELEEFDKEFYKDSLGFWISRAAEGYGSERPQMGRAELFRFIRQFAQKLVVEIKEEEKTLITSKRFWLIRTEDISGVSGTGVVADGVSFPDGISVLRWRTAGGSTAVYDSMESLEKIHGHDGRTKIEYVQELNEKLEEL